MNDNTIIKPDDIRKIRPIAENMIDCKRIESYIREAETLDLIPLIGANLYQQFTQNDFLNKLNTNGGFQVITNSGSKIFLTPLWWNQFINGDYYTCKCSCNPEEIRRSEGLASAIAYLAYSRMLPNQPINVTSFGVVRKTTEFSDPVDEKTLLRAVNEAKKIGLEYMRQAIDHLRCEGYLDECKKIRINRYKKFKAIG